jgi:putative restriction endonuclease
LLVAFNLYCKLPFGQLHYRNPRIVELAGLLNRTPGAVAMKLTNFAAFDPIHQQRGVKGLTNTSQGDRQVWDDFNSDWEGMAAESEKARASLSHPTPDSAPNSESSRPAEETERQRLVRTRLGQDFFRSVVLASYGACCCVCGLPEEALLVASHIVPWAAQAELRVNPHNGLCLCALHDRAFDRGLLTVDANSAVCLSDRLEKWLPHPVVEQMFTAFRGQQIRQPEKFSPDPKCLEYHRSTIFQPA